MLSRTVSRLVSNYGPADAAKFWLMFNKFFDLMNVSRTIAFSRELKPFNAQFSCSDDPGFSLLRKYFLKDWFRSIEARSEAYTKSEKRKMFMVYFITKR